MNTNFGATAARNVYKLFVGNLSWTVGNRELLQYFSKYGHVATASVNFDKNNGMSKGYGFVVFSTLDGYNAASSNTIHTLDGRVLSVEAANV